MHRSKEKKNASTRKKTRMYTWR